MLNDVSTNTPGDDLGQIYRSHYEFVRRSVQRLGVPDAQAEDVAHDVFIVAHRRLSGFEGRSTVRTWLFGIARRVAKDHHRSARRSARRLRVAETATPDPVGDDGGWIHGPGGAARGPEETVARKLAGELLGRMLARMDGKRRVVFAMFELEGMSAPEISARLGIGINTVYSRLRLARERFAELLSEFHGGHGERVMH
jgi:RNA polymerase sigma-70 factor (ECF subfamily)